MTDPLTPAATEAAAAATEPAPAAEPEPVGAPPVADEPGTPPAAGAPEPVDPAEPVATVPLDALRALVLRAYPEALPELVSGDTLEALLASAERARELRARLLAEAQAAAPPVAAGAPRGAGDPEAGRLSPLAKIAWALAGREQ